MVSQKDIIAQATNNQLKASNPQANVFVSASAGSGKTTLLVDRLLRLMLPHHDRHGQVIGGSDPEYILCLTYTRSGAAEMAIKLQERLGKWVGLDEKTLDSTLDRLQVPRAIPQGVDFTGEPDSYRRLCARRLFFQVLDLPTGMRIGTIHAFCQSILRSFPVEASINPRFSLMENVDVLDVLKQSIENAFNSKEARSHVETLSRQLAWDSFVKLGDQLHENSQVRTFLNMCEAGAEQDGRLTSDQIMRAFLCRGLKLSSDFKPEDMDNLPRAQYLALTGKYDVDGLLSHLSELNAEKKKPYKTILQKAELWSSVPRDENGELYYPGHVLKSVFLTEKGEANKKLLNAITKLSPELGEKVTSLCEEIVQIAEEDKGRHIVCLTMALFGLLKAILRIYDEQKIIHMQVEYPDLVRKTLDLLSQPGEAAWVMYKLDGGIDHILLDEVQDTSPQQWQIVSALTTDFFAGQGIAGQQKQDPTLFAVGDPKQSIFAFQGANLESFYHWKDYFKEQSKAADSPWVEPDLSVSFRSSPPILTFVDSVFADRTTSSGVIKDVGHLKHISAHPDKGGKVEIWPLVPKEEKTEIDPFAPVRGSGVAKNAAQTLAKRVAAYLGKLINEERRINAGDVLILLPARNDFVEYVTRALKERDIAVTNLMRTALIDCLAIRDVLSLCEFLLLPEDDLTLAKVLRSPIGDLDEDQFMPLAQVGEGSRKPGETLWSCLTRRHEENPAWAKAWHILSRLLRAADYITPYRLVSRALDYFGARARFTRRLGQSAQEQLDVLLAQLVEYQTQYPPSLQGFVDWFARSKKEISPQAESNSDAVRIMTAHGAKGMEAELVVLPYTSRHEPTKERIVWQEQHGISVPYFAPAADRAVLLTKSLKEEQNTREKQELNRLLYVALTRAKSHLVICGWGKEESLLKKDCWYTQCRRGFDLLTKEEESLASLGMKLEARPDEEGGVTYILDKPYKDAPIARVSAASNREEGERQLPIWAGQAPDYRPIDLPDEYYQDRTFVPSRPDEASFGELPGGWSPLTIRRTQEERGLSALDKGLIVHSLLQFLPNVEPAQRVSTARQWLELKVPSYSGQMRDELIAHIVRVMDLDNLSTLFGPGSRSEQRITGRLPDKRVISGQVDRMVVTADQVIVCDYKSGIHVPKDVSKTPRNYLVQMAAYRFVLRRLYPHKEVKCFLIWVEEVRADLIPDSMMDKCDAVWEAA